MNTIRVSYYFKHWVDLYKILLKWAVIILLNLFVLYLGHYLYQAPEYDREFIVSYAVGIGIIIFLGWSFIGGLIKLIKLSADETSYSQVFWNIARVLVGGMFAWYFVFSFVL